MKKKQLAKLGVTLGLVAAVGVGGTLAVLSQTSGPVTNTFAVGKNIESGDFSIKETQVKYENGNYVPTNGVSNPTVTENNYMNVLPKASLYKDPTVLFDSTKVSDMPTVYMFVKVDGLDEIYMEGKGLSVEDSDWGSKWKKMDSTGSVSTDQVQEGQRDGIYVYEYNSSAQDDAKYQIVPKDVIDGKLDAVFTELNVADDFGMEFKEDVNDTVQVWACAVQYDNVTLQEAYNTAVNQFQRIQ